MSVNHNEDYYYRESKRLRDEVLLQAEALKGNPLRVRIDTGIRMYKPYAIISQQMFDAEVGSLHTDALP